VGNPEFDHKDARKNLQSASGGRGKNAARLLDEEDMVDEREMRRAQNRLKRRDYEELADLDDTDQLFKDPLEKYEEIVQEVPSQYEDDQPR
jgi:hypothetical protein